MPALSCSSSCGFITSLPFIARVNVIFLSGCWRRVCVCKLLLAALKRQISCRMWLHCATTQVLCVFGTVRARICRDRCNVMRLPGNFIYLGETSAKAIQRDVSTDPFSLCTSSLTQYPSVDYCRPAVPPAYLRYLLAYSIQCQVRQYS